MASQTFSIKLTANGKEVIELQNALKEKAKEYEQQLDGINEKLKERDKLTEEEIKDLEKQSNSLTAKIKALGTAVEENITNLRKVDDVLKNLAGSSGAELGKALRGVSQQFKRVSDDTLKNGETMEGKLIEIKEKLVEIRHEMAKRDGIDAMKRAQATLTDLANTPLDKLKMGLDAIEKKLATMSEAERKAADGMSLIDARQRYKAQIAVTEYGRAGTADISKMNADQLRAEQTRLRSGYMGTEGATGYEAISEEYLKRLQAVNQALKDIGNVDISKVLNDLKTGNATLGDMEQALKQLKESADQFKGKDDVKQYTANVETLEQAIDQLKAKMQGIADIDYDHLENVPTEKLEAALKSLEAQEKKLAGTQETLAKQVAENKARVENQIHKNKVATQDFAQAEQVAADTGSYSAVQLQKAYDVLKIKLTNMASSEREAIKETQKQMKTLKKAINEVSGEVTGLQKVWQSAVRNIATYAGLFASFGFIKGKIMEVAKSTVSLSDSMAQVQKVTGLTKKEVDSLNESFANLDTRTTLEGLNDLAYISGKMGLGKYGLEGVRQFVEAANQLQVALGDDLGSSVEESIMPVAKLAENLGVIQKMGMEKSMLAIGSAINELSQTTTAAGRNIVDFARRIQPSAQMIGLTTDEILALGSASDSFGISSEISATAFTKFLAAYRTNTAEIERILGITRGTLDEFFDQGRTMEGLMTIFQRMHDIGDLRYLEEAFKALGSEGSRMFTTFGAFAKNIDMFREHLTTSTVAFAEATSVTREYNLVQDTAAGILERANNIWEKAFVNPKGVDMVKELAVEWYKLSESVTQSETYIWGAKKALESIAFVAGVLIKLLPILIRAMMFYGIATTIRKVTVEWNIMNTAIKAATTSAQKFGAFMRSNIWVLGATAIAFAVTALIDYTAAANKAKKALDSVSEAEKNAMDESVKERAELKRLYDATKDTTKSIEERKDALRKMVGDEKYQQYKSDLNDEQVLAREAAKAYSELTDEIIKSAKARAYQQKITELTKKNIALEDAKNEAQDYVKENEKNYNRVKENVANSGSPAGIFGTTAAAAEAHEDGRRKFLKEYEQKQQDIIDNQEQMTKNDADILKLEQKIKDLNAAPDTGGGGGGDFDNDNKGGGSGNTKELNAEYTAEQAKAKGLIDNIKNYYQRQMNAVRELANQTDMSEGDLQGRIDRLTEHMNEALANARKAIGGEKNEWEKFKADMRQDLYEQTDEEGYNFSENLLDNIMDNQLNELRKMILVLSEKLNKQGNVLLDQILRKATENEGKNISLAEQQRKALEKEMLERNFTGKVDRNTINTLERFDIGGITAQQDRQMIEWSRKGDVDSIRQFIQQRLEMWQEALAASRENFIALIDSDVSSEEGQDRVMRLLFGENYQEALTGSALEGVLNMNADKWKVFYQKLIDYNDEWTNAQKKAYDEQKKLFDQRWERSGKGWYYEDAQTGLDQMKRREAMTGADQGTNFAQMAGFVTLSDDPEIAASKMRMEQMQQELELARQVVTDKQLLREMERAEAEAELAYQEQVMVKINERISKLQEWTQPIEQFGADIGDAFGKAISESESFAEGMRNALSSMAQAWGEHTIEIVKQLMMQQLKQKMINRAMQKEQKATETGMTDVAEQGEQQRSELVTTIGQSMVQATAQMGQQKLAVKQQQDSQETTETAHKTIFDVLAGIAGGSAKTIESLGWWGIPLVAVISALLMGLLNTALSALSGSGSKSDNTAKAKTNVKLASGMLTYDEGNVGIFASRRKLYDDGTTQVYSREDQPAPYLGQDGQVYMATPKGNIPEGVSLVRKPIATTVNGQPALVAEKGPEIVIGRRTTQRLMMDEPRLLHHLAMLGNGSRYRGLRTFDDGNVGETVPYAAIPSQPSSSERDSAEREAMMQTLAQLTATVAALQGELAKGIKSTVDMYGRGGLDESMTARDKFRRRYRD